MSDAALADFIGQIENFSFKQRLSILSAVINSLHRKNKKAQDVSKADALYGLIKDSEINLESARSERLSEK